MALSLLAKKGRFTYPMMRPTCWAIFALSCFSLFSACSYKKKYVLFKNRAFYEYYKAHKHEAPVIKLHSDTTDRPYHYRLQESDVISVQYVNVPEKLLDIIIKSAGINPATGSTSGGSGGTQTSTGKAPGGFSYSVDAQGYLIIPVIGRVYVKGKTLLEIRRLLEERFSEFVTNPIIDVQIASLKVYVVGEVQNQGVLVLPKERTSLMEVLLLSGGFTTASNTKRVQIIRGEPDSPQVIWINLQDLNALQRKELIVQANDIIYVEPRGIQLVAREVVPYTAFVSFLTLLTTLVLLRRYLTN